MVCWRLILFALVSHALAGGIKPSSLSITPKSPESTHTKCIKTWATTPGASLATSFEAPQLIRNRPEQDYTISLPFKPPSLSTRSINTLSTVVVPTDLEEYNNAITARQAEETDTDIPEISSIIPTSFDADETVTDSAPDASGTSDSDGKDGEGANGKEKQSNIWTIILVVVIALFTAVPLGCLCWCCYRKGWFSKRGGESNASVGRIAAAANGTVEAWRAAYDQGVQRGIELQRLGAGGMVPGQAAPIPGVGPGYVRQPRT